MSDENAGAAGAGATGGDAGAAGTGGAAGTAAAGATAAAQPAWHGYTEPADVEYVKTKGWTGPQDAVKSYREAEKHIGRDPSTLMVVPRADDPAGQRAVLSKIGLPETADKYEFSKPEGGAKADESYEAWARATFHQLGLTGDMAKGLTAAHNKFIAEVIAKQETDYNFQVESDKRALLAEWRGGHERMTNAAQTAAKSLGFTHDMIDAMEKSIGYAGTWKFFANLGSKMGEDSFVTGGDKGGQFGATLTPAEAKVQWEAMKTDEKQMAALKDVMHPGNAAAKKKQEDLFKVMYPV